MRTSWSRGVKLTPFDQGRRSVSCLVFLLFFRLSAFGCFFLNLGFRWLSWPPFLPFWIDSIAKTRKSRVCSLYRSIHFFLFVFIRERGRSLYFAFLCVCVCVCVCVWHHRSLCLSSVFGRTLVSPAASDLSLFLCSHPRLSVSILVFFLSSFLFFPDWLLCASLFRPRRKETRKKEMCVRASVCHFSCLGVRLPVSLYAQEDSFGHLLSLRLSISCQKERDSIKGVMLAQFLCCVVCLRGGFAEYEHVCVCV